MKRISQVVVKRISQIAVKVPRLTKNTKKCPIRTNQKG